MKTSIQSILKTSLIFFLCLFVKIHPTRAVQPDFIQPFSSEISPKKIGQNIFDLIRTAQEQIIIVSDKCTNQEFLDDLLGLRVNTPALRLQIVTGEDRPTATLFGKIPYNGILYTPIVIEGSARMHNKFMVIDGKTVITGSPNATYAAYNYNVESFVAIHNEEAARLYLGYFEYLTNPEMGEALREAIVAYNGQEGLPLQICLAPLLDIRQFVVDRLTETEIVSINMFLISGARVKGGDIIEHLCRACQAGAQVTLRVDKGQFDKQKWFMLPASRKLIQEGAAVFVVEKDRESIQTRTKRITSTPQFHDKLILIQYHNGVKRVIMGSAGFTTNVQENLNFENMVSITNDSVYDYFLQHFDFIEKTDNLHVDEIKIL